MQFIVNLTRIFRTLKGFKNFLHRYLEYVIVCIHFTNFSFAEIPDIIVSPAKIPQTGGADGKPKDKKKPPVKPKDKENRVTDKPKDFEKSKNTPATVKPAQIGKKLPEVSSQGRRPRSTSKSSAASSASSNGASNTIPPRSKSASENVVTHERVASMQKQMNTLTEIIKKMSKNTSRENEDKESNKRKIQEAIHVQDDDTIELDDDEEGLDWLHSAQPALLRQEETRSSHSIRDDMPLKRWTEIKDANSASKIRKMLAEPEFVDNRMQALPSAKASTSKDDYIVMGIANVRDINGRLVASKTPACCASTYAGVHQKRLWKQAQVSNLQASNRDELIFLRSVLLESVTLEGYLEEALRRLFLMHGPPDVQNTVHHALDDLMQGNYQYMLHIITKYFNKSQIPQKILLL